MYQEWFEKFNKAKEKGQEEKCLCRKAYEEIDMYYLMSLNEAKGTLQIFKNRGNGNFGMLFTEIPISYCPMCRKEAGRVKRYASGYWYQFIIPRRLTLPPTRIYRWLNFYWRLKDKEE